MSLATRSWLVFAGASLLLFASPAHAEDPWKPPPHVRPQTADARALLAEGIARSPALRDMVDRLERSDVIVYIRHRVFAGNHLDGWIAILSNVRGQRYLVIELACGRTVPDQIGTLGHELHHALEIAGEPSIVDARSLAAFYERVGMDIGGYGSVRTFETLGARQAGLRVRRDATTKTAIVAEK